jgi:beta-lactamase superfamily II metal-dependent hydrolase
MGALAHKGITDSSGGHSDSKNVSGLGSYHYHHGYGAHLHINGCPYSSETQYVPKSETSPAPPSITGILIIVYLDVGQADSIFIMLPNGETVLIDAGEQKNSAYIIQYIRGIGEAISDIGETTLDYIIATHPHADHIGGMVAVMKAFEVKNIFMPDITHTTKTFENLLDTIEEKGLTISIAKAGNVLFDYGNLKAEFIAPNGSEYSDLNDYSAVLLLTYNDLRFIFTGDAEEQSESEMIAADYDISADVLKVGHHGSDTSSTRAFIQEVAPKYAVISSGAGNSYGHPAEAVLAMLNSYDIDVRRTDTVGTVIAISDGRDITVIDMETEAQ